MLTDLSFLSVGSKWVPPNEYDRLENYKNNMALYDGDFNIAYNKVWNKIKSRYGLSNSDVEQVMIGINLFRPLTEAFADLTLPTTPVFTCGETKSHENKVLQEILKRSEFGDELLNKAFIDAFALGNAIFRLNRINGKAHIEVINPDMWFPICDPLNKNNVLYHVIAYRKTEVTNGIFGRSQHDKLVVEIHGKGIVVHQEYMLDESGVITKKVSESVNNYGRNDSNAEASNNLSTTKNELIDIENLVDNLNNNSTNDLYGNNEDYSGFLIFPLSFHSTSWGVYGQDAFTDLIPVVEELIVRLSNNSKILDDFADPTVLSTEESLEHDPITGERYLPRKDFLRISKDGIKPEYLTWDGDLDNSQAQIDRMMSLWFIISGTNPQLFGQDIQGGSLSGQALQKIFMRPLQRSAKFIKKLKKVSRQVLEAALALEGYTGIEVTAEFKEANFDSLDDVSNRVEAQVTTGIRSIESAVLDVNPDWTEEQVLAEVQRIKDDNSGNDLPVMG